MARVGGRPRQIETGDIIHVGRELGMRELSMNAVASRLGVSSAALYRHVDGRWGLERLVGESLLGDMQLRDDASHDVVRHLLSFGLQLRVHILEHPGLAAYLQTLFPRGENGRRLLADEVDALGRRGYSADAAVVLCGAVASLAIGYAAAEDAQREHAHGLETERQAVVGQLRDDVRLAEAHETLPVVDSSEYVRLMLTAAIQGLVGVGPPGRAVEEIIAELHAAGEGV